MLMRYSHFAPSLILPALVAIAMSGCVSDDATPSTDDAGWGIEDPAPIVDGAWYQPNTKATWQWQLVDAVNSEYQVEAYDIDLFQVPKSRIAELQSAGFKVICYFSAGSYESFRPDSADFPEAIKGLVLDGFEDEQWLDVRDPQVFSIMETRLDLAVEKGCDGVEPDNVDGYQNDSGFPLSDHDQLLFNKKIANAAHTRNLAVGLKNDLDQISNLVDYFDFSVNEQCHEFDECDTLLPFIGKGKPVWNAEYKQAFVDDPSLICPQSLSLDLRTLILPLDLNDAFRIPCD